ncbi:MAG TPA: putative baseplate assembly protein [Pyrinomonadaceae bacterium]|nr:putative baseplate assembly protein [Pyrinomonadaceae bacterium]
MSRRITTPKIDSRTAGDLFLRLREMAPHYTREWPAREDDDPGVGLLRIFSFIAGGVIGSLNRAPERNFIAFLDMLGIRLLPKRPSRVPVRFLVAQGTEDSFLVAQGTQVSAPPAGGRPEEQPFVTLESLSVIPGALGALVAVDPSEDIIYKPPPGFLALELSASDAPPLVVQAFSSAGSKSLQLDLPEQLAQGDFLRLESPRVQTGAASGCLPPASEGQGAAPAEYVVVADRKGKIVILAGPLARDYSTGAVATKVTQFELFEGKNFQEHILYLAHGEFFDIKSEAQIELTVEHAPGSSSNLLPLDISWEFFGVTEDSKEDGWKPFGIELDGSSGLSRDGRVVLSKPPGEIKETTIDGNESRWIRARLAGPIPATPPRSLPEIESISLTVSSAKEGLPADQAFHNDTPLTVNLPFNPFGPEPRIFDRFYLASQEAFSKPGAEVKLDVRLDFTDLLAAPAAVALSTTVRVFARGAAGRLVEFPFDLRQQQKTPLSRINHATPRNTRVSAEAIPAVVSSPDERVGVFVKADDDQIHLCLVPRPNGNQLEPGRWLDLQAPPGKPTFNPAAALREDGQWEVFVVSENKLYSKVVNPQSELQGAWIQVVKTPDDVTNPNPVPVAASSPFALRVAEGARTFVYVVISDLEGRTWVFNGREWADKTPKDEDRVDFDDFLAWPPSAVEKPAPQRPFALLDDDEDTDSPIRIFLRNRDSELVSFDTPSDMTQQISINHGAPDSGEVKLDSNAHASESLWGTHVFVRGSDNQLWRFDLEAEEWYSELNTQGFNLASDPFSLAYQVGPGDGFDSVSVFSTSDKNSLLEFHILGEEGRLQAGPLEILLLADELADLDKKTYDLHITDDFNGSVFRQTLPSHSAGILAVLDEPLDFAATEETEYEVFARKAETTGRIVGVTDTEVTLPANTSAVAGDYIFVNDQLRILASLVSGQTFSLDKGWSARPSVDDPYILRELIDGPRNAAPGAARSAVLRKTASDRDDAYNNLLMEITSGAGESPYPLRIEDYVGVERRVIISEDFDPAPEGDSAYQITGSKWGSFRDQSETELRPELSWEYWNGKGWMALRVDDRTENFLVPQLVSFTVPDDMSKTEVAGQENYWIRSRIVGGDYGRELFVLNKDNQLEVRKDPIRPPLIKSLTITYKVTEQKPPQFTLTFNNMGFLDQTAANVTRDKHFSPYLTLPDESRALYFGFDKEFDGGPVRLYFDAAELVTDERDKPKLAWEFYSGNKWQPLPAKDRTDALTKPGFITWTVPGEFQQRSFFGETLFWIRARLVEGAWKDSPKFRGVFINTVEAMQARTISNEILGSSTGLENERFRFKQLPVLEGEEVRVREALTEEEREQLRASEGDEAVRDLLDLEGRIIETWVRWKEVLEFFDSDARSRHYRLDRHSGELEFGDGVHGRIPQAGGDNIRAFFYQAGGGAAGNVKAGEINTPVTAVAGVASVINPVAAGGGSEAATVEEMLEIGPAQVSHRDRAVTPEDFERLALETSREVRKVRCIPNRNRAGRQEVGWTSVYVVPDSKDERPQPSLELRRSIQRHLAERADLTMVAQDHLFVGPARYVSVDVEVLVFAKSFEVAGEAERRVREGIKNFLHPLTGGPAGEGWDFGRDLAASDLYLLLENIEEVDHVARLVLHSGAGSGERVEVAEDSLLSSGTHTVNVNVTGEEKLPETVCLPEGRAGRPRQCC